jgi:hypothetical protein
MSAKPPTPFLIPCSFRRGEMSSPIVLMTLSDPRENSTRVPVGSDEKRALLVNAGTGIGEGDRMKWNGLIAAFAVDLALWLVFPPCTVISTKTSCHPSGAFCSGAHEFYLRSRLSNRAGDAPRKHGWAVHRRIRWQ